MKLKTWTVTVRIGANLINFIFRTHAISLHDDNHIAFSCNKQERHIAFEGGPDLRGEGGNGGNCSGLPLQGAPRDEIYLFQIKYSFEKFRDSEAIQEYNSILYSYVALSIKGPQ